MMTTNELDQAAIADMLSDARHARRQASDGPFYPDRDITPESLRAYADNCDRQADVMAGLPQGNAHRMALTGGAL